MTPSIGYHVTMRFRVVERGTDRQLMESFVETFQVQPPAYAHDDKPMLEMYLELKTKIRCMVALRKRLDQHDPAVEMLRNMDFTVRGTIEQYIEPEKMAA